MTCPASSPPRTVSLHAVAAAAGQLPPRSRLHGLGRELRAHAHRSHYFPAAQVAQPATR